MRFSVIIPVYNTEKYLERCVDSVLEQNYKKLEIILVNDGSKDNSLNICERYNSSFSEIVLIHQKNQGLGAARNRGIEAAKGEYLIFLDSDDYLERDALYAIDAVLRKEPLDLLGVVWNHYDLDGNFLSRNQPSKKITAGGVFCGRDYIKKWGCGSPMVWQYIFSRNFIERNRLYFAEGIFHEDCEYMVRAYLNAKRIYNSDIAFYNYCYSPKSIIKKKNLKKCQDLVLVSRMVKKTASSCEKSVKRRIENYASYLAWEAVRSCVRQGYDLKSFLSFGRNRSQLIGVISGINKYSVIRILLSLHLDAVIVRGIGWQGNML